MPISLSKFLESDCQQVKHNRGIFIGLYRVTFGDPCPGCAWEANCEVKVKLRLAEKQKTTGQQNLIGETNKEIADSMGISPRQVAKMRKRGEL